MTSKEQYRIAYQMMRQHPDAWKDLFRHSIPAVQNAYMSYTNRWNFPRYTALCSPFLERDGLRHRTRYATGELIERGLRHDNDEHLHDGIPF